MKSEQFLVLWSFCETIKYTYHVEDGVLFVTVTENEGEACEEIALNTMSLLTTYFFDVFETYYEHEDFADEKMDDLISALPMLNELGLSSRAFLYTSEGNADVYLHLQTPVVLYFRQEYNDDDIDRTFSFATGMSVLEEIRKERSGLQTKLDQLSDLAQLLTVE